MDSEEFKSLLDKLMSSRNMIMDELKRLRIENERLLNELNRVNKRLGLPTKEIHAQKQTVPSYDNVNLILHEKLEFPMPIYNIRISKSEVIGFTSNNEIFLYDKSIFYMVSSNGITSISPQIIRVERLDQLTRLYTFMENDLILLNSNKLIKYKDSDIEWSLDVGDITNIEVENYFIYLSTSSGKIMKFQNRELIQTYNLKIQAQLIRVYGGKIIYYGNHRLGVIGNNVNIHITVKHILSLDIYDNKIYTCGLFNGIQIYTLAKLELYKTLMVREPPFYIKVFPNIILSSLSNTVLLMSLDGEHISELKHNKNIVKMEAYGKKLVFLCNDGSIEIYILN